LIQLVKAGSGRLSNARFSWISGCCEGLIFWQASSYIL
jgi:hypothetical protein